MGRLFSYILLSSMLVMLLIMIHPVVAMAVGFGIIAGTLFYIAYLLKKEQPRIIEDRLRKHFLHIQKSIQANEIDETGQEKESRTADL
ncbi:hypothetical protein [Brevibacillus choshinensis]|uniref:hypothetical protein n=1 Tax=Brevibacillus choshinensis TaxID=54911 RepID=UPI002E23D688|nr:hypothetical protein [Brevibacillus choshinensis]MED4751733.1 hypothetical protein [Brevibacillus choshinensis]MED4780027.1 hypothetical protein [Brevibacillus choshinensis]